MDDQFSATAEALRATGPAGYVCQEDATSAIVKQQAPHVNHTYLAGLCGSQESHYAKENLFFFFLGVRAPEILTLSFSGSMLNQQSIFCRTNV